MNCLVTLAPDDRREPYGAGVRDLESAAAQAGWNFRVFGDDVLCGDRPWQAKRHALRWAFGQGAKQVIWCDSDVVVFPGQFAQLLSRVRGAEGIWVYRYLDREEYLRGLVVKNGGVYDHNVRTVRVMAALGAIAERFGFGVQELPLFEDWLVGYAMPPALGLQICDVWDAVAEELRRVDGTWTDGLSLAIAARVCGVRIGGGIKARDLCRAVVHLLHSRTTGRYERLGVFLP